MIRSIAVRGLRSLAWAGDDLVDWIGGHHVTLAGEVARFGTGYSYRFDGVAARGDVVAMFETLGTKGRLARANGARPEGNYTPIGFDELRELDRSYYQATAYAYPACILALPDGREAIAHCPVRYDTLEIELLDGTPLTRRDGKADDIFHSRLAASPDGKWLLSNGWVWQPWNIACVYDVARALVEPAHLNGAGLRLDLGAFEAEVDAAALSGDRVIVSASADQPMLSVIELPSGKTLECLSLDAYLGTSIMAWGPDHIVALDGHPRVVALADGAIVEEWPEVSTEIRAQPSVALAPPAGPYVAIDPLRPRFAVAGPDGITVISRD